MLTTPIPDDLCPLHREHARYWRENHYDPRKPTEWPGGIHIVDSRTSHEERARRWDRKNREQIDHVAAICRSGRSPQCNWPEPTAA